MRARGICFIGVCAEHFSFGALVTSAASLLSLLSMLLRLPSTSVHSFAECAGSLLWFHFCRMSSCNHLFILCAMIHDLVHCAHNFNYFTINLLVTMLIAHKHWREWTKKARDSGTSIARPALTFRLFLAFSFPKQMFWCNILFQSAEHI